MTINVNGVELPELTEINPITKQPYSVGDITLGSDGKTYINSGMTWVLQQATESQQGEDNFSLGTSDQPNVLFEGKATYDPSTGNVGEGFEEKSWASSIDFMASLRNKKDQTEYNRYANALKNSPFWSGGKKITRSAVDSAWKSALYSSAVDKIVIQDLLFNKDAQNVAAGNESATSKYNNISYYTNVINRTALQQGVNLDSQQIKNLASQAMSNSWDVATLQENVAKTGTLDFGKGAAAATITQLKEWAADNGMSFDNSWFETAASNVITGKSTLETEKQTINSYAKGLYSAEPWVKGIDSGFSVRQQASPYINYLAKIRGVDPTSISLSDPILMKNLTKRDDKGNPVIPSYYDFTLDVRKNDPSWGYSYEAQEETTSMLNQFGKMFGKSW
jgi:hypothetical protein